MQQQPDNNQNNNYNIQQDDQHQQQNNPIMQQQQQQNQNPINNSNEQFNKQISNNQPYNGSQNLIMHNGQQPINPDQPSIDNNGNHFQQQHDIQKNHLLNNNNNQQYADMNMINPQLNNNNPQQQQQQQKQFDQLEIHDSVQNQGGMMAQNQMIDPQMQQQQQQQYNNQYQNNNIHTGNQPIEYYDGSNQEQMNQLKQMTQMQHQQQQQTHQVPDYLKDEEIVNTDAEYWKNWYDDEKLRVNENYQLFKIPKIKESIEDSYIIGVIDQSGSMGECFQWLAKEWNAQIKDKYEKTKVCIFHNLAYVADQLQEEPEMGTTDVETGFQLLNNTLISQDVHDYVTIIFVSDGKDDEQETIFERLDGLVNQIPKWKKINFLTIGVGEEFPTYLAMQLRQMYHNGESNIPPVFLVYNQVVHDNWKVTFNLVNKYLQHSSPLYLEENVQKFPWCTPSNIIYENSWVFRKSNDNKPININGVELAPIQKLTPKEVLEVGSQLTSNIQLQSLQYEKEDATFQQSVVAQKILANLKQKWWRKGRKKKEEKEQLELIEQELQDMETNPNVKNPQDINEKDKDQNLALKLAVGSIAAGIGLYWLSGNYSDFANIMSVMDFSGQACCGECGVCDQCAQCLGCDNCGQCCGDIIATGENCMGGFCECFYAIMESACGCICGMLE